MKKKHSLDIYKINITSLMTLPIANDGIHTGFPLLVQDYVEMAINHEEIVNHPASSLIVVC